MSVVCFRKDSKASLRTRLQARKRSRQSRVRVNMMSTTCGRRAAFEDLICRNWNRAGEDSLGKDVFVYFHSDVQGNSVQDVACLLK